MEKLSFCICLRHDSWNVIESKSNPNILCNITSMQYVCSHWRNSHFELLIINSTCTMPHLEAEIYLLIYRNVNPQSFVHILSLNLKIMIVQHWSQNLSSIWINNLDWLYCERSLAVLRELGHKNGQSNVTSVLISACDLNETVLGLRTNLSCIRIDDWRKRKHSPILIIEHRIVSFILQYIQVWLQL